MLACFADPKLHLAMLDEVMRRRAGYSWVATLRDRYEALQPTVAWSDLESGDPEHASELEQLLASLEIELDEVAQLTRLTLDGDRDLYAWVYPSWWDFGDHFEIHDLSGIEQCTALEYLLLGQGLVSGASLAPLARLPRMRELLLCARCDYRDLEALLEIPSLAKLYVVNVATSKQRSGWETLVAELRMRGVVVSPGE